MTEAPKKPRSVKSPLHHDGKLYAEGAIVNLTDAEAETLEALGIVGEAEPIAEPPVKAKEPAKN